MKINPRSRRAFLQGLGGASLAVPFLPSLVPSRAEAAERPPMRFAMMYYPYGNTPRYWWDNNATAAPSSDGAYQSRALSDIAGSLSTVLGASYDGSIRKKLAVVRGLDPLGHPHAHNATFATCADSGEDIPGGMFGWQGCTFRYSVDS